MTNFVLCFVNNTGAYRCHESKCTAAVGTRKKTRLEESFESIEAARAWADADESNKAGVETKANFKACECCTD